MWMHRASVVIQRGEEDVFVKLSLTNTSWRWVAYDERGVEVELLPSEILNAIHLALSGVDETGF
jgi:hypothetical protein